MGEPTEPTADQPPARRKGTIDDIAGFRLYYRLDGDPPGDERWVDWQNDRGPSIAEAMAVRSATVSNVNVARLYAVLRSSDEAWNDPEALQAAVWMIRRFRQGEGDLVITALSGIDLFSLRQDYFDAQRVFLDFAEDDPTDEQVARATEIAAELRRLLPAMTERQALSAGLGLVAGFPDEAPAGDAAGEGDAGEAGPAETSPPTPKTSKRSSGSGSRSSRSRTGSSGKTSSGTRRTRG